MAPITSDMVVAGRGNKTNKGSSLFGPNQTGSVEDSPTFSGGTAATHSEVVSDPGSTGTIPGSDSGTPGEVPTSFNVPTAASGSGAGTPEQHSLNDAPEHPAAERQAPNIVGLPVE